MCFLLRDFRLYSLVREVADKGLVGPTNQVGARARNLRLVPTGKRLRPRRGCLLSGLVRWR